MHKSLTWRQSFALLCMYCPQLIRLSYRMCLNRNSVTEASPKGAGCDLLPLSKAGICAVSADRDPRLLTGVCLERGMCIPLAKQSPIFINYSLCLLVSESLSHPFWVGRPPVFTIQTVSPLVVLLLSSSIRAFYVSQEYITPKAVAFLQVVLNTKCISHDSYHKHREHWWLCLHQMKMRLDW